MIYRINGNNYDDNILLLPDNLSTGMWNRSYFQVMRRDARKYFVCTYANNIVLSDSSQGYIILADNLPTELLGVKLCSVFNNLYGLYKGAINNASLAIGNDVYTAKDKELRQDSSSETLNFIQVRNYNE